MVTLLIFFSLGCYDALCCEQQYATELY